MEIYWATLLLCSISLTMDLAVVNALTDIEAFESIQLCNFLGAHCNTNCRRELKHRWGIPLCRSGMKCCAEPPPGFLIARVMSTPAECEQEGGRCIPWYRSSRCNGTMTSHECSMQSDSCCMPSLAAPPPLHYTGEESGVTAQTTPTTRPTTESTEATTTTSTPQIPPGCGRQSRSLRQKRIVGGEMSQPGHWPWHVGIRTALGNKYCAGTLINNQWILTAAHCFKRVKVKSLYRIVVGTDQEEIHQPIDRIIKHKLYREDTAQEESLGHAHKYDIALVKLGETVMFTDYIQPACLPSATDNFEGEQCWLTGWGSTSYDLTDEDVNLRHVQGTVLDNEQCQELWGDRVDGNMTCFGNPNKGACRGDSGGGMFCESGSGQFTVAGIISWGSAQCNQKATVLTDLTQYRQWIQETMNNN